MTRRVFWSSLEEIQANPDTIWGKKNPTNEMNKNQPTMQLQFVLQLLI